MSSVEALRPESKRSSLVLSEDTQESLYIHYNHMLRLDCYIKHTHHQDDKDFNMVKWCYRGSLSDLPDV